MPTRSGADYSDKSLYNRKDPSGRSDGKEISLVTVLGNHCNECEKLKRDLDSERSKREHAENIVTMLYEQKRAVTRELEVEKSWRRYNQNTMTDLISKLPSYEEKDAAGSFVKHNEQSDEKKDVSDSMKVLQDEVQILRVSQKNLLQKNVELKKQHTAEVSVLEDFRNWVESEQFTRISRFKQFQSCEIEKALEMKAEIGSGGYGKVYKTLLDGKGVAIKLLDQSSNQGSREFDAEVDLLGKTHHPNLVNLIGSCKSNGALVYEFLGNITLNKRLETTAECHLSWKKRIEIAFSLCSVLIFLHNLKPNPIVHGDLKPENILFDADGTPKIGDFGIAYELVHVSETGTFHHVTAGTPRGSSCYFDPEFRDTGKITPGADVYAFGVILLQLVTGNAPSGLRDQIKNKLISCKKIESKSMAIQKKVLIKMQLIDNKLRDSDEWMPCDVLMLLKVGIECAAPERRKRASLSGSVWHELKAVLEGSDRSG